VNNDYGFNHVMAHDQSINTITNNLRWEDAKTSGLVLDVLTAVCLVGASEGGHARTLSSLDNFKAVMQEPTRFHTLVQRLQHPDSPVELQVCPHVVFGNV